VIAFFLCASSCLLSQDKENGGLVGEYGTPQMGCETLAFSCDNKLAFVQWAPRIPPSISIIDLSKNKVSLTLEGHKYGVSSVRFAADGKRLVSGGWDGQIVVWDLPAKKEKLRIDATSRVTGVGLYDDDSKIASVTKDGIVVYDAASGKKLASHAITGSPHDLACSKHGRIGCVTTTHIIIIEQNRKEPYQFEAHHTRGGQRINRIAFSPDGSSFATSGADGCVRLWKTDRLRNHAVLDHDSEGTSALAFSPDGKILATVCSYENVISFWDVRAGKVVANVRSSGESVQCVAFSPDGKYFAAGSFPRMRMKGDLKAPRPGFPVAVWEVSKVLGKTALEKDAK
jgi:WD40 repeat protein